jgi:hypothetical protein
MNSNAGFHAGSGAAARGDAPRRRVTDEHQHWQQVVLSRLRKEYADQILTVFEGPRGDYEEKQARALAHAPPALRVSTSSPARVVRR